MEEIAFKVRPSRSGLYAQNYARLWKAQRSTPEKLNKRPALNNSSPKAENPEVNSEIAWFSAFKSICVDSCLSQLLTFHLRSTPHIWRTAVFFTLRGYLQNTAVFHKGGPHRPAANSAKGVPLTDFWLGKKRPQVENGDHLNRKMGSTWFGDFAIFEKSLWPNYISYAHG